MSVSDAYKELARTYPSEASYPLNELIEIMGIDKAFEFVNRFSGINLYVPTIKRLFQEICIQKQLTVEFDGGNYAKLAKKYGICERTVRKIING